MEDDCLQKIEEKYNFTFKPKQKDAIKSIVNDGDTFVVLPTGYGKTKIYVHLPEIYQDIYGEKATVLVISPLQALMIDQVTRCEEMGIQATFLGEAQRDKCVAERVKNGQFDIVFCSPEAAITPGLWRRCLTSGEFQSHLRAVVIDEAHCIVQWGKEFRKDYGKLIELRSIVPTRTAFITLSATITATMKTDIMKLLGMDHDSTTIVSAVPDRPNLKYCVRKISDKTLSDLQWLVDELIRFGINTKKTIIYCRNINTCANLYNHFKLAVNEGTESLDERVIAMFHRSTAEANKNHVLQQFPKVGGNLRVVFATVAFGMGVDIPDVECVIHWGGPRTLEQFSQESGRAGRDGRQSHSIVYYNNFDLRKDMCTEGVKEFCKSETCLRETIFKHFRLNNDSLTYAKTPCCCCSVCDKSCACGACILPYVVCPNIESNSEDEPTLEDTFTGEVSRMLSIQQLEILRENLIDFRDCLHEEGNKLSSELDQECIKSVVRSAEFILCVNDLKSLSLVSDDLIMDVMELIEEV